MNWGLCFKSCEALKLYIGFGKAISRVRKREDNEEKGWKAAFAKKEECKEEIETV